MTDQTIDIERCRRRGIKPLGFMSHTIPVCWLTAGHDGPHKTSWGATIEEVDGNE